MIKVNATIKLEFEIDEADAEMAMEGLANLLEYKLETGEIVEDIKFKFTDMDEDSEEPELEDEED